MICDHWKEVVGIYYQCPCCNKMTDIFVVPESGIYENKTFHCGKCGDLVCVRYQLYKSDCKMRIAMKSMGGLK